MDGRMVGCLFCESVRSEKVREAAICVRGCTCKLMYVIFLSEILKKKTVQFDEPSSLIRASAAPTVFFLIFQVFFFLFFSSRASPAEGNPLTKQTQRKKGKRRIPITAHLNLQISKLHNCAALQLILIPLLLQLNTRIRKKKNRQSGKDILPERTNPSWG